jgi:hypothetical protein
VIAWSKGDEAARSRLIDAVYAELRRLARVTRRGTARSSLPCLAKPADDSRSTGTARKLSLYRGDAGAGGVHVRRVGVSGKQGPPARRFDTTPSGPSVIPAAGPGAKG